MTEDIVQLNRKYGIAHSIEGDVMNRLYWNVETQKWTNIGEATLFNSFGEAKFLADNLKEEVTAIWTDK